MKALFIVLILIVPCCTTQTWDDPKPVNMTPSWAHYNTVC